MQLVALKALADLLACCSPNVLELHQLMKRRDLVAGWYVVLRAVVVPLPVSLLLAGAALLLDATSSACTFCHVPRVLLRQKDQGSHASFPAVHVLSALERRLRPASQALWRT